jgi:hypothetical protein
MWNLSLSQILCIHINKDNYIMICQFQRTTIHQCYFNFGTFIRNALVAEPILLIKQRFPLKPKLVSWPRKKKYMLDKFIYVLKLMCTYVVIFYMVGLLSTKATIEHRWPCWCSIQKDNIKYGGLEHLSLSRRIYWTYVYHVYIQIKAN